jgi:transposase
MQDDTTAPTGGVDWATDTNEQCIVDAAGVTLLRGNTSHDAAGIRRLVEGFTRHGVRQVAIERPDGPVVDALLAAGLEVVVITPRQVKHLRARYGAAGNKDDRFDAYVLADVLRTDGARLTPLTPDSAQTLALRSAVRARTDLVEARVALCNQLRALSEDYAQRPSLFRILLDGAFNDCGGLRSGCAQQLICPRRLVRDNMHTRLAVFFNPRRDRAIPLAVAKHEQLPDRMMNSEAPDLRFRPTRVIVIVERSREFLS